MDTYTQRLAAIRAREREAPKSQYLSNADYARQKATLARAKGSGDPARVLKVVEDVLKFWDDNWIVWPDDWETWRVALEDAAWDANRQAETLAAIGGNYEESDRLWKLHGELAAASFVLFP